VLVGAKTRRGSSKTGPRRGTSSSAWDATAISAGGLGQLLTRLGTLDQTP
jgi:hypothetical protein